MSVREYIGARYVPMFADPVAWDSTKTYEPLTVVIYLGNSYTSRQYVPAGIDISNGTYWVQTGNYNAQIDQYRAEVTALAAVLPSTSFTSTNTVKKYVDDEIDTIEGIIGNGFDSTNTVKKYVDDEIDDVEDIIGGNFDSTNTVAKAIDDVDDKLGTGFDSTNTVAKAIDDVDDKLGTGFDSTNTVKKYIDDADTTINGKLGTGFDSTNTVKKYVDDETTARQNADTALSSRISTLEETKYMVVIGDSFSDPDDGSAVARMWPEFVAKALNLELKNFAKGGSGFCVGGANIFSQQLITASNQISDHSRVKKVFIFGGINDVSSLTVTYQNIKDDSYSLILSASETFPNADITVIGICPTRNADRHGNASDPFSVSADKRHRSDIFTEFLALSCAAVNGSTRIKNAVKYISLRNFPYLIDGFYQSAANWHPSLVGHMAIASKILGGDVVHDPANYDGGLALTALPTYIDSAGVSHDASNVELATVGANLAQVSVNMPTPAASGSTQRYILLNGLPSGPAYLVLYGANTGKAYVCAGEGPLYARNQYRVPSSYDDTQCRFLYTFGV